MSKRFALGTAIAATLLLAAEADRRCQSAEIDRPDLREIVRFSGGVVELRSPLNWRVYQASLGRELRLVLAQQPPGSADFMPDNGLWLTIHASSESQSDIAQLCRMMPSRLQQATHSRAVADHLSTTTFNGHPAIRQEFSVYAAGPAASDSADGAAQARGFHLLVGTPWGVIELHAVSPAAQYDAQFVLFQQTLDSLTIREPRRREEKVIDATREASPILGSWKAYRSALQLRADGRIVIQPDAKLADQFDVSSDYWSRTAVWITGKFEARDDLLRVHWDDGSRSNYRWRLHGVTLLLTDHEGRISQLTPIYEAAGDSPK